MQKLNIILYIIGEEREHFINLAKEYNIAFFDCHTIDKAVKKIDKNLKENEIALLSPACASLDQFKNYKKRGEEFKKCIKVL